MKPQKRKIFISADIEGISGVSGRHFTEAKAHAWELGRRYMVEDVNAAIRGVLQAAPGSEIVVRDAHGGSDNIVLEKLHPGVRLISGWPHNMNMLEGLDRSFDACFFVGYHSRGLVPGGVLAHTFSGRLLGVSIGGSDVGETAINAFLAGGCGVPVVLVTGDDKLRREARPLLPWARFVVVKRGIAKETCEMLPLDRARSHIENEAREAVLGIGRAKPYRPRKTDFRVRLSFEDKLRGLESLSDFTVRVEKGIMDVGIRGRTPQEIYDRFALLIQLAHS
ncbi:MAG: M55 family metallopeptidase [Elusimicrobiota bacterium]